MQHFFIAEAIVLEVSGRDALRYLHNRLTNDIRSLTPGELTFAAALTPQGKTEGFFSILRVAEDRFILICDGGDPAKVIAGLKRFIVADRVEVVERSANYRLVHVLPGEISDVLPQIQDVPGGSKFKADSESYTFNRKRALKAGFDVLTPSNKVDSHLGKLIPSDSKELSEQEQTFQRTQGGWPQFPSELNESTLFSESGLIPVAASFRKGCYVGQEVLEKVEAFGSLPRTLKRGVASSRLNLEVGGKVYAPETEDGENVPIGKIVTTGESDNGAFKGCFISVRANDEGFPDRVVVDGESISLTTIL